MEEQINISSKISTCNIVPDKFAAFGGFMPEPPDNMQIYDTDITQNRIGFYCLGGETRNRTHLSDWDAMLLTIKRWPRPGPLHVVGLYERNSLSKDKSE